MAYHGIYLYNYIPTQQNFKVTTVDVNIPLSPTSLLIMVYMYNYAITHLRVLYQIYNTKTNCHRPKGEAMINLYRISRHVIIISGKAKLL